jgi:hypothetical protein
MRNLLIHTLLNTKCTKWVAAKRSLFELYSMPSAPRWSRWVYDTTPTQEYSTTKQKISHNFVVHENRYFSLKVARLHHLTNSRGQILHFGDVMCQCFPFQRFRDNRTENTTFLLQKNPLIKLISRVKERKKWNLYLISAQYFVSCNWLQMRE